MRSSDKAIFATLLFLGMTSSSFAHYGHHAGGASALVEVLSSTSVAEGASTLCSSVDRYKAEIREMRNVAVQYLSDYEESPH